MLCDVKGASTLSGDNNSSVGNGRRKLVGLMNSYTQGMSGGDLWFIEVMKRFCKEYDLTIVTSALGVAACLNHELVHCQYIETSAEERPRILLYLYLLRTFGAIRAVNLLKADILYSSSDFFPDVIVAAYFRRRNSSSVWVQKIYHLAPKKRFLAWLLQRFSLQLIRSGSDLVLVDNIFLSNQLERFGIPRNKVRISQPGLSIQDTPKRKELSERSGAVYLGRIHHAKGIRELIDIWAIVCGIRPGTHLNLIGTGDRKYLASMKKVVDSLGLSNEISFLGFQADEDVANLLQNSRVFVTASSEEGFGISILEALAVETPVVCWDIDAFREAFGPAVLLTPIHDNELFAKNVVKLLNEDVFWHERVEGAKNRSKGFSWDSSAAREQSLIESRFQ